VAISVSLGVAVISSAVQDLKKLALAGKESGRAGASARAFLTVSNPNLEFWCGVADFDMNAILRKYWPDAGHPDQGTQRSPAADGGATQESSPRDAG
jgi:hypothetical protein